MKVEVDQACNFIRSMLQQGFPTHILDPFIKNLSIHLMKKYKEHWYTQDPSRGSGYRCINCSGDRIDPIFCSAWESTISSMDNSTANLSTKPNVNSTFSIWIDPGIITTRIGENGSLWHVWEESNSEEKIEPRDTSIHNRSLSISNNSDSDSDYFSNTTLSDSESGVINNKREGTLNASKPKRDLSPTATTFVPRDLRTETLQTSQTLHKNSSSKRKSRSKSKSKSRCQARIRNT